MTSEAEATALALAVGRLYRRLRTGDGELSHGLFSALATVTKYGPIRLAVLATRESVSAPSATRLVTELENQGLVEREMDPADGRAVLIRATPAGREIIQSARSARVAIMSELLDGLDAEDYESLSAALPALERLAEVAWPAISPSAT
jgi:DNA-binding MarR family transcriptional regulator